MTQPDRQSQVYTVLQIDGVPPGVNHYVKHTRNGIHYVDSSAKEFKALVALACIGKEPVYGHTFEVEITVMLGKGKRGDVDGFPKLVLDAIAQKGMLRNVTTGKPMSDAHVSRLVVQKERGERSMTTVELMGIQAPA